MTQSFAFYGNERFLNAVQDRLVDAKYARVEDGTAADVVISFCMTQSELEDLYFGDQGLVQTLSPDTLVVDLSAASPTFAREVNAVATINDLVMVEAPLVVADMAHLHPFVRENISCFAASEGNGLKRAHDLLDVLFSTVYELDDPESTQLARASATLQAAAWIVAIMESRTLCMASLGLSKSTALLSSLSTEQSDAYASMLDAIENERFDGDFTVEMFMSEIVAALTAADDVELILPQAEAALHMLELLAVIGGADKTPAALSLTFDTESKCAKHGLDWSRAEKVYGSAADELVDAGELFDDSDHDDLDDLEDLDDPYSSLGFSSN